MVRPRCNFFWLQLSRLKILLSYIGLWEVSGHKLGTGHGDKPTVCNMVSSHCGQFATKSLDSSTSNRVHESEVSEVLT